MWAFRKFLAIFICSMAISHGAYSQETLSSGRLHLTGMLVGGDCIVDINEQGLSVDMGNYRDVDFSHTGDLTVKSIPFNIHLSGCSKDVLDWLKIAFHGTPDRNTARAYETYVVDGSMDSGKAGGVGLVIFDSNGDVLMPNAQPVSVSNYFAGNKNTLSLTARYQKTASDVTPGILKTTVWFDLIYP